ncbi:hypothetical protein ACJRO7_020422 [Eucalyptus globulus]|uniref:Uncharacterized protein n=1 Tax=Eucalyptus globulus TaxID=34317 RepID=A0ABD3KI66_EUCGL
MNGMQIPARTSSAPPNLDEQKRDQACHDAIKTGPPVPVPPPPKHPLPKRDLSASDHSIAGSPYFFKGQEGSSPAHSPISTITETFVHAISGIPIQMLFNQPQVPIQFSGPNTSIQSQGMASAFLQMPNSSARGKCSIPVGNAPPMQQQIFVAGLQPHMMQPQGIMHQGQGLNFGAQMNSQFSPKLGTLGMAIGPYNNKERNLVVVLARLLSK